MVSEGARRVATSYAGARALVTGAAGFLGSSVCRALVGADVHVYGVDSFITGLRANVEDLADDPRFELAEADVVEYLDVPDDVALVLHLASPASPVDYLRHPIHTMKVGSIGTLNALG
ncbi:MAG: NAD-dependent epimerase/dehydratase family protein, partial [Nitriliruptoraceae bacterium]